MSMWEELGIAPTGDLKEIKRAYARGTRVRHPEDDPEGFRRLHDAYEAAAAWAKRRASAPRQPAPKPTKPVPHRQEASRTPGRPRFRPGVVRAVSRPAAEPETERPAPVSAPETREGYDFGQLISEGLREKEKRAQANRKAAVRGLLALYADPKTRCDRRAWSEFLQSMIFTDVRNDPLFLPELCEFLLGHKDLETRVWLEFYDAYDLQRLADRKGRGPFERLYEILSPRYTRFCMEQKEQEAAARRRQRVWLAVGAVGFFALLFLVVKGLW